MFLNMSLFNAQNQIITTFSHMGAVWKIEQDDDAKTFFGNVNPTMIFAKNAEIKWFLVISDPIWSMVVSDHIWPCLVMSDHIWSCLRLSFLIKVLT